MSRIHIKFGNEAAVLKLLGSLYRNPADAIKEHISNAIDEHLKAKAINQAFQTCQVRLTLEHDHILIEYPYGMSRDEFESALSNVASSTKKKLQIHQIGRLGIGMLSFFQLSKKCVYYSKKDSHSETLKVTFREGSAEVEFENAIKRESMEKPGIRILMSGLLFDPTKPRGPISPDKLQKVFSEKFDHYLKNGSLEILICCKGKKIPIKPQEIALPKIGECYRNWPLSHDPQKKFSIEMYFDPIGKGIVAIRHIGVSIIEDIRHISAYGLEDSVYASGDIRGYIDADFLTPLPSRTAFEENSDWIHLLDELFNLMPSIQTEVDQLKQEEADKKLTEVQRKALELAREILSTDEFKDLEFLEGLGIANPTPRLPPNGFDFVPASARIEPGRIGVLTLKAYVPDIVPDNSKVLFTSGDSSIVELKTSQGVLMSSCADSNGIVSIYVPALGKTASPTPIEIQAYTVGITPAIANIHVASRTQTREPKSPGVEKTGPRITYEEVPFEEGSIKHSRYIAKKIQINNINTHFIQEVEKGKSEQTKLEYATLMIGKETIAFNDKTGVADEFLERLLSFHFELRNKLTNTKTRIRQSPSKKQ